MKQNSTTSPSAITYSLPSMRALPVASAAFIDPAVAEWLVRMLVSLAGTPGSTGDVDDREALSAYLQAFLGPVFGTK